MHLFSLRNIFCLGAYQDAINKNDIPNLTPNNAVERDSLVYHAYIALGSYQLVISEIDSLAPTALQAIKLLTLYLVGDKSLEHVREAQSKGFGHCLMRFIYWGHFEALMAEEMFFDLKFQVSILNKHEMHLFSLRNIFCLGAYQDAINKNDIPNLTPNNAVERDSLVYHAYIALGSYQLVISEIDSLAPTALQAIKLLTLYLVGDKVGFPSTRTEPDQESVSQAAKGVSLDMDSDLEMEIDSEVEKKINTSDSSDGEETKKFYLFDKRKDDAIELVVTTIVEEYYNLYLCKQPYRNDNLTSVKYVMKNMEVVTGMIKMPYLFS
ncbi:hypothetical protein COCNU_scaffold002938G000030 [Cocos nucifera]|nr:hypothetical protein [Cocos nucifera]